MVIHHTVGRAPYLMGAAKREMRSIQRQHMGANGWSDIGYNVVIDRAGRLWEGRGLYRVGAHTLGHNTGTVGISFMGNYEVKKLNKKQIRAFYQIVEKCKAHGMEIKTIKGHRQMPRQSTACPGKNIMKQLSL